MSKQVSFMPDERERPAASRKRHPKPWEVWYRVPPGRATLFFRDWVRFGRYRDEATARAVVSQKSNDRHFEYEVRHAS